MVTDNLSIYQLRNIITAAQHDEADLSLELFSLPQEAGILERNRLKAKILNRKSIIKRAQDIIDEREKTHAESPAGTAIEHWNEFIDQQSTHE